MVHVSILVRLVVHNKAFGFVHFGSVGNQVRKIERKARKMREKRLKYRKLLPVRTETISGWFFDVPLGEVCL